MLHRVLINFIAPKLSSLITFNNSTTEYIIADTVFSDLYALYCVK